MIRIAAVLALLAMPVAADDADSMTLASDLGAVLAGGEACGYTLSNSAVIAFVQENAPAEDVGFAAMLSAMTTGHKATLDGLSDTALIAQCAVVEKTARHFGFMD